jgi:ABC-2 type transport system ATP-binding protein
MTIDVSVEHLSRTYGGVTALDDVSFSIATNTITGLLGRNGAGKSTLMRILTGHEFLSSGSVQIFGEDPVENDDVLRRMVFIKESQTFPDIKLRHVLDAASWFYPNWDKDLAFSLVGDFALPVNRKVKKFSRGMMSAVGIVLGIAARAELTFFDEPYLGLDAVARQLFYDRLLADYAEHPRTIVLSTHLIDEISNLLENVLVLDHGRLTLDAPADDLRGRAVTVSGSTGAVDAFVRGQQVWHRQAVGSRAVVTVAGPLDGPDRRRAVDLGLELEAVSLQDVVVQSAFISERV